MDKIAKGLRLKGFLFKLILPHFTKRKLKLTASLINAVYRRHSKKLNVSETLLPRADGSFLRVCVYSAKARKDGYLGTVLWLHGGGYAFGKPEAEEGFIRLFTENGFLVVSPDYTLSVRAPFPAAIDDCYSAFIWLKNNASALSADADKIIVGGNSAGGGLAAALCLKARRDNQKIAAALLIYPMLDDTSSLLSAQNNKMPFWNTKSNIAAWKMYLGELYGNDNVPAYAAPFRLTDCNGLPPSFTYVGTLDPFYDETLIYFERLRACKVTAEAHVFSGCYHGFDTVAQKIRQSKTAHRLLIEFCKKHI